MKKFYPTLLFFALLLCAYSTGFAQTTETFETETGTSFTDNGQTFNITSQAGGTFDVQASFPGTGWNGTGPDNRYIDNDGYAVAGQNVQFTIKSGSSFIVNNFWLYLANQNANVAVAGSVTITGKLGGATVYTATQSTGFNTNAGVSNGFSKIDLTTFGGLNNANKIIDELIISTGGSFYYVALDAFNWTKSTAPEINIQGNSNTIVKGDVTPSTTDHTDFGSQSVCSGTIVRTFTIQNTGTGSLTINSVIISGAGSADFSVTTAPSATVTAGASTTFQVTFNPSASGARNATITVNNNDADEAAYDFAITGTGTDPEINIQGNSTNIVDGDATPSTTDHTNFGSQSVCSGTIVRTFTIQNTGNSNLTISSVIISGAGSADFSVTTAPNTPVAAGASTTFQVTFNPSTGGARNATITVNNNDCDEAAYDFAITGTGTDPEINIQGNSNNIVDGATTPSTTNHTDFGTMAAGISIVRTFTIQNTGTSNLTISGVNISGAGSADFTVTTAPNATVGAGASTTFQVTFIPSASGARNATITVNNNDCDEATYDFAITGTGTVPTVSSVNSTTADGAYKIGDPISIQVNFSETVTVTGTPQLTLETGTTDRTINYAGGSGSSALTFTYTIQAGDVSADLDYVSTSALSLNGGTIKGAGGINAVLTLPAPGAANSLGANRAIVVDGIAPTITIASVSFSSDTGISSTDFITNTAAQTITGTLSGALAAGDKVLISLDNGATYTAANVSGTNWTKPSVTLAGSNTLKVVVEDAAGNRGTVYSQAYVLDTTAPTTTIASVSFSNDTGSSNADFITKTASQTISGTLSGNLNVGETVYVSLNNGTSYTVATASVGSNTWSLAGVTLTASNTLRVAVEDAAGNRGTVRVQTYILDTTVPTVSITSTAGATTSTSPIPFTVTFSESVTDFTLGDISVGNGTATNFSGSGTTYTFNVTPTASGNVTINVTAAVATDIAGNGNTAATQLSVNYQGTLPVTLVNFTAKAEGNYAKLQWQTTQEVNSSRFAVYRGAERQEGGGVEGFVKIGEVSATINHQPLTINNYTYTDKQALNGNNYYKLVQIDNDGKETELGIRTVTFHFQPSTFNLYPNPTTNKATVVFAGGQYHTATLADISGKTLKQWSIGKTDGSANIELADLPSGTYLLRLSGYGKAAVQKVVKQ